MGVPITMETIGDGTEVGYRVRPDDYCLPGPRAHADETAALRVAVSAISLGDGSRVRARSMKLGGVGDQDVGADRVAADRARARDAVRRVPSPRGRHVLLPRRDAHRRAVGPLVEARPLVRRRLRPRPRGHARVPGRPHRRRRRGRRCRTRSKCPPTSAPTTTSKIEAWLLGDAPTVNVAPRGRRRPSRRCGRRARTRGSRRQTEAAPMARVRRRHRHQSRRVPELRARLSRARRDRSSRPRCAPR